MKAISFNTIDWSSVSKEVHQGETGTAIWQTIQFDGLRIRMVEYSRDYKADHWCEMGHIVQCIKGSFISQLKTGENLLMLRGMTYVVTDKSSSHRSVSDEGATLLIIDGDFLKT